MSDRQPINETRPHLKEFMKLLAVARNESERGTVLVHASMLDNLLRHSIEAFLIEHRNVEKLTAGFNAPIGTFSARTLLAYALGVISQREYEELERIRKIRNEFAHSIDTSFNDPSVASRCNLLTYSAEDYGDVRVGSRGKFVTAAAGLILALVNRPHYVRQRRLTMQEWER